MNIKLFLLNFIFKKTIILYTEHRKNNLFQSAETREKKMKINKNFFLFSGIACLTFLSTNTYGMGEQRDYNNQGQGYNNQQGPRGQRFQGPRHQGQGYYNNGPQGQNGPGPNGPGTNQQVPQCSSMDLRVFEEEDEVQTYKDYGFSRGDMKNLYTFRYDPKNELSINGHVAKVMRVRFPDENSYLIAVLKTDSGEYLLNLGPVWFADENNFEVNEGDVLDVKGSKIKTKGRFIIIASEVKKDGQTLVLRNRNGSPQWGNPQAQRGGEQYLKHHTFNRQDMNRNPNGPYQDGQGPDFNRNPNGPYHDQGQGQDFNRNLNGPDGQGQDFNRNNPNGPQGRSINRNLNAPQGPGMNKNPNSQPGQNW